MWKNSPTLRRNVPPPFPCSNSKPCNQQHTRRYLCGPPFDCVKIRCQERLVKRSCHYGSNWSLLFSKTIIITVSNSVAKKRIVKTDNSYVNCGYSDNWNVWLCETIIIILLKSVVKKRLVKTEDSYVNCGYSDNWRVRFSGTAIVGCGGDP
jgi:hypothetical protein